MRIIDRIDELLNEKGLLAKELAQAIGVSPGNVTDWRKGRATPSADVIAKISVYLGVSTDYLHGLTDIRYPAHPGEVAAASGLDYNDIPPEAREELEQYKEFLRQKYGKKK